MKKPLAIIVIGLLAFFAAGFLRHSSVSVKPEVKPLPLTHPVKVAHPYQTPVVAGKSVEVPVLMYHHVGYFNDIYIKHRDNPMAVDLTVSPADFELQVKYLKDQGYQTVTLKQVYDALENGVLLPSKPIVFTFDDGYKDVFVYAVPISQKYGYIGTFAIATNLLDHPSYAVWDDIINAQKAGMEIVSHTENHLDLSSPIYSDADLRREIFESKQKLEEKLGTPIEFFVYPYGRYDDRVLRLVSEAGYKMAFTTNFGTQLRDNNLLTEPRVRVHGQNGLEGLKRILSKSEHSDSSQPSP